MAQRKLLVAAFDGTLAGPDNGAPTIASQTAAALYGAGGYTGSAPQTPTTDEQLDRPSSSHKAMSSYWEKVDTILGGIDAFKDAGQKYLPRFPDEPVTEYRLRLAVAKLTNVFTDIIDDLSMRPFAEEIKLDTPPKHIEDFCLDVDGSGNDITQFGSDTFYNGIAFSIEWIFVDFPKIEPNADGRARTREQDKQDGVRPLWSHVRGMNVLEVRSKAINSVETITYFRMLEPATDEHPDRVRIMESDGTSAVYSVWQKDGIGKGVTRWTVIDRGVLTIGKIPMVPFATGRRDGSNWCWRPPMKDAADLQIKLYQNESDLENAKVRSAYAMISANGVKPPMDGVGAAAKPKRVATGPGVMLFAPPDGKGVSGSYTLLEPAATSLTFLQADIKVTKEDLRELGRQPLTAQSGNITVITAGVAAQKGNSAVKAWAILLGLALENAVTLTGEWMANPWDKPKVNVFTDFEVDGQQKDQNTLVEMRNAGDLSQATFWQEMIRRGVLSPDFDADAEVEAITKENLEALPGDANDAGGVVPGVPSNNIPTNPPIGKPNASPVGAK